MIVWLAKTSQDFGMLVSLTLWALGAWREEEEIKKFSFRNRKLTKLSNLC